MAGRTGDGLLGGRDRCRQDRPRSCFLLSTASPPFALRGPPATDVRRLSIRCGCTAAGRDDRGLWEAPCDRAGGRGALLPAAPGAPRDRPRALSRVCTLAGFPRSAVSAGIACIESVEALEPAVLGSSNTALQFLIRNATAAHMSNPMCPADTLVCF